MAEKSRQQWSAAIRRWFIVGVALGFAFGVFAHLAWDSSSGLTGLLGSVAFYVLMGAAMVVILWAGMYRYHFATVWGWGAMGLTMALVVLLIATSVSVGCLQGICGEP